MTGEKREGGERGQGGGDTSYRGLRRVRARGGGGGRRMRGRGERREGATPNIGAMQ